MTTPGDGPPLAVPSQEGPPTFGGVPDPLVLAALADSIPLSPDLYPQPGIRWGRPARRLVAATAAVIGAAGIASLFVVDGEDRGEAGPCTSQLASVREGAPGASRAGALLSCLTPSLVFIETEFASGSGVILEGGYVVTNLHVIDPFTAVDVTLAGGKKLKHVPVKGADAMADIALLGPIADPPRPAHFASDTDTLLEKGDDVFLTGFPGEVDEEPEPTISKGILSRVRAAKEFGQTYLQTDAAIGSGQSGGALINSAGEVLGISGLNFAENFALALSSEDVRESIEAIKSGAATAYRGFPEEPAAKAGTFHLDGQEDGAILLYRTTSDARTIRLTLNPDARPAVSVDGLDGTPIYTTREFLELGAVQSGIPLEEMLEGFAGVPEFEVDEPVSPGVHEFEIPEETFALISIGTLEEDGADISYEASHPLVQYDDTDQDTRIGVGDRAEGVIEALEDSDTYVIDLQKGAEIEIFVGSGPGDMAYLIQAPDQPVEEAEFFDDSNVGLAGYDAKENFTAKVEGRHVITVVTNDFVTTGYVLKVSKKRS